MDGFVNVSFLVVAERNDLHSSPIVMHEFPHIIGEDQKYEKKKKKDHASELSSCCSVPCLLLSCLVKGDQVF